jgi:phosphoglycerate dehydrogenase-like enzyme
MKPIVLLDPFPRTRTRIFNSEQWDRLNELATIVETGDAPMADDDVERWLPQAVAIIGQTTLPRERLERAPKLRAVINVEGNFFQNIDYDACFARGISVLSIAPAFATPVAEMCVALALDLARGVTAGDHAMRDGTEVYGTAGNPNAVLLSGARVGIIGYGNLGRALRRMLAGFRAQVSVYDPWLPASVLREEDTSPISLDDLLANSQFIIVLAGVTSENQGLLDRAKLELIRRESIIVLASRAAVVDFEAFIELANAGRFRAATDVFPSEPVAPDHHVRQQAAAVVPPRRRNAGDFPCHRRNGHRRPRPDPARTATGQAPGGAAGDGVANAQSARAEYAFAGIIQSQSEKRSCKALAQPTITPGRPATSSSSSPTFRNGSAISRRCAISTSPSTAVSGSSFAVRRAPASRP